MLILVFRVKMLSWYFLDGHGFSQVSGGPAEALRHACRPKIVTPDANLEALVVECHMANPLQFLKVVQHHSAKFTFVSQEVKERKAVMKRTKDNLFISFCFFGTFSVISNEPCGDNGSEYKSFSKTHVAFDKVKVSYVGSSFSPSDANYVDDEQLLSLKIHSDCVASSFGYGDSGAFNLCEIFDDDVKTVGAGVNDGANVPLVLSGNIVTTDGSKLNFENAGLYTSSKTIPLNFECVDRVSLFPGKCLAVKGLFNGKNEFVVQNIIQSPSLPPAKLNRNPRKSRVKLIVAAGCFSLKENDVSFAKLVDHAIRCNASALIMVGPFLKDDFETNGSLSTQEIFLEHLQTISKLVAKLKIRVIIIPCHSDINALPHFPTPPYSVPEHLLADNVSILSDPAVFELEGVQFAVCAAEVICHLSKREIYKFEEMENSNEDRISRLIGHILSSKSLYPLYPADVSLPFVLKKSKQKIALKEKPHVLILPSVLQPTVKVIQECVCINPGRFIRGKSSGTFANMEVDISSAIAVLDNSIALHCEVNIGQ